MDKRFIGTKRETRIDVYLMLTLSVIVLFGTNMLFNGWICAGNRVFYLDDLSSVNIFLKRSAEEFIFVPRYNKIRVIAKTIVWVILKISQENWEILDEVLLMINFMNAIVVFAFIYIIQRNAEIVQRCSLALVGGILYIASRFAYYNISELWGVMEGVAITFALGILLLLFLYMESDERKYFYSALAMYVLLIFTHERYFVLFILFFVAILFQRNISLMKKVQRAFFPLSAVGIFWAIRIILFGNRAIEGTGGVSVSDSFEMLAAIKFCFSQVMYILEINCGPAYLNGIEAKDAPFLIRMLIFYNIVFILCVLLIYLRLMIKRPQFRHENLNKFVMFISFIGLCVICSSITIRVEMRWLYVSYAAYLIFIIYMLHGILVYHPINIKKVMVVTLWVVSILVIEHFYRMHYRNIYYWQEKDLSRELYEVTVEKYGTELDNKNIIIIGDVWKDWTKSDWKNFFAPYLEDIEINVVYVESVQEAERHVRDMENIIVLFEDSETRRYTDLTNEIPIAGVVKKYGIYEDGWCDMDCEFDVIRNITNRAELTLFHPENCEIKGNPSGTIIVNDENQIDFELTNNLTIIELELEPYSANTVQVKLNYWTYENTGRSEDGRISSVLTIDADF